MNEEKDFFKTCFNTVVGLEVKNESQAIAKEVVLSEIENLQQENKQLKERIEYLERSNNRREDTILEQRQEISNLEDNCNKLKKWIDSEIENRDSEDLLKLYVELQEDNETLLSRIRGFKSQQKEFMTFLEDNWKETQDIWYIKILNKYKEIIGDDK